MENVIEVIGAKEHNLKNVSVKIPRDKLVVITGPSGSGKSSLAFDTVYAEGQRRYVESLSAYARQFLQMQNKPDVESISGLSPAIAIDQKTVSRNPRSTVATATEIYDYLRVLYARAGVPYSPATGKPIKSQSVADMRDAVLKLPEGTKIHLLAPFVRGRKGEYIKELQQFKKQGFTRFWIDGEIYAEDELPELDKKKKHDLSVVVDRLVVSEEIGNRLPESIEAALHIAEGLLHVDIVDLPEDAATPHAKGERLVFSEKFACPESGFTIAEIEPRLFSFNSPYGACQSCDGLGKESFFDPDLIVGDTGKTLTDGAIVPWQGSASRYVRDILHALGKHYGVDLSLPFEKLDKKIRDVVLYGSGEEAIEIVYDDGMRRIKTKKPFEGVIPNMERRYRESDSEWVQEEFAKYMGRKACKSCDGHRLNKEALCVKIAGLNIGQVASKTIDEAARWFHALPDLLDKTQLAVAERVFRELNRRIGFLRDVGLGYLTLDRESGTLSGGESQRIRLASQIGSGLSGVLYVLDEPSIGLHQRDNERLLGTLKGLRDLGNTVLVVEHDEDTMREADYLIDVGPGAGVHGGTIVAMGTPAEVAENPESVTGRYLSGREGIAVPETRRPRDKRNAITLKGARANNLKNVDFTLPLGCFTCVAGVSGGGKSSLIMQTFYRAVAKHFYGSKELPGPYDSLTGLGFVDKVIRIDQSPIGRTPRSNPATYTGAFAPMRDWFAALPEAKARGYKAGRFSFNVKGGRCENCQGDGLIKIEMHFLPDVYVVCDACKGKRYNRETMEVRFKGHSIADVLEMTTEQATELFDAVPAIRDKLQALCDVGLGYIHLGQSATTLSGGEAQRIKLAKELSRRSTGRTLYILDEPTTGLHACDVAKLLSVLHTLADSGNTVLVIEHNLDVIKTADYVVDIGPEGGEEGGRVVAEGTPEEIAANESSVTGPFLRPLLSSAGGAAPKAAKMRKG
ncbi:MAG: excinuclease ABC subunit UvrA [Rickettsiales bacterium]